MKPKLLFNKKTLPLVLEALGKEIDERGFVIDSKTKEFVLDYDGNKFKFKDLIGILNKNWITKELQLFEAYKKSIINKKYEI